MSGAESAAGAPARIESTRSLIAVHRTALSRRASDHLPLQAVIDVDKF